MSHRYRSRDQSKVCRNHKAGWSILLICNDVSFMGGTEKFRRVCGYQGRTLRAPASTLGPFPHSGSGDNVAMSRLRANLARQAGANRWL